MITRASRASLASAARLGAARSMSTGAVAEPDGSAVAEAIGRSGSERGKCRGGSYLLHFRAPGQNRLAPRTGAQSHQASAGPTGTPDPSDDRSSSLPRSSGISVRAPLGLAVVCAVLLTAPSAWGYRPFVSTDAAIANPGDLEVELGYFQYARTGGQDVFQFGRAPNVFSTPTAVLNYGLTESLELVGQFTVERELTEGWALVDNGLFVKAVLKEGVLQDRAGPSIALEVGPLLPASAAPTGGVGFESIGILSLGLGPVLYHFNAGGGIDQVTAQPFGIWGTIAELLLTPAYRLVGEIAGEDISRERPQHSALLGVIWRPFPEREIWLDAGVRRGLTRAVPDWQATLGISFAFPLTPRARHGAPEPVRP
jgi:hypothetical protein